MSALQFDVEQFKGGLTLFAQAGTGSRDTAVHLVKPHEAGNIVDVLLWFHGFYVKDARTLFSADGTKVRDIVAASGKDLVVIAPHQGFVDAKFNGRDAFRKHSAAMGGGAACEDYLDEVLAALGRALPRQTTPSAPDPTPPFNIGNLYMGCHSGGGIAMKAIVGSKALGKYKSKLRECWGFDCVYGETSGWEGAVRNRNDVTFYVYFGQGTQRDSGGTPVELWNLVYGRKKADNIYMAPCFPGVEDDTLAFQSVDDIKKKPNSKIPYEMIRRDTDRFLGNAAGYWKHVKEKYWLKMKSHYAVSADLLGPRIAVALP